jgi:D-amino-acid oxidase
VAAERGEGTTSSVAAALWYPYRALPRDSVTRWSRETYSEFAAIAEGDPTAGVRLVPGRELIRDARSEPWWRDAVPRLEHVPSTELPGSYHDGWELRLPVADMNRYLPWLEQRLADLGGSLNERRVESLDEALRTAPTVVNCAGLAAGRLAGDDTVFPIRGQVVVVERPPAFGEWLLDQSDEGALTYIVPREETVVLGGTANVGREDTDPEPTTAAAILERCVALAPALAGAPVVGHRVGLRPGRPTVRLEAERRPDGIVVHCYGHGGAGVTLSWGCAADAARLVAR